MDTAEVGVLRLAMVSLGSHHNLTRDLDTWYSLPDQHDDQQQWQEQGTSGNKVTYSNFSRTRLLEYSKKYFSKNCLSLIYNLLDSLQLHPISNLNLPHPSSQQDQTQHL